MHRRQEFVLVAKVVLADMSCSVAMRFEELGHGWILRAQAEVGPRQPNLGEARTDRILASDERRSTRGAALLSVVVGEGDAFVAHAVDVGRAVAHLPAAVVADIPPADVIALEDENVRLALLSHFYLLLVSLPISGQLSLLSEGAGAKMDNRDLIRPSSAPCLGKYSVPARADIVLWYIIFRFFIGFTTRTRGSFWR